MRPRPGVRILVVADATRGRSLLASLSGMELGEITLVDGVEEARRLCAAGAADACLHLMHDFRPDEPLPFGTEAAAPGRDSGVPSLLLADIVTPFVTKAARRSGYVRAVAIGITARLLCRTIRAALQRARRTRPRATRHRLVAFDARRMQPSPRLVALPPLRGKATLH